MNKVDEFRLKEELSLREKVVTGGSAVGVDLETLKPDEAASRLPFYIETVPEQTMPSVAVLMCTKEGGAFLRDQLSSIRSQTHTNTQLYVSDDGSKDKTLSILQQHQFRWRKDRFAVRKGPQQGYAANFLSLICDADIQADYYAFADQDDAWDENKLSKATSWLDTISSDVPALYCSRTRLIDPQGQNMGFSMLFTKQPSFANALVQNIAAGNTIVMNQAARALLLKAGSRVSVVSHDWWAYLLITGAGGMVKYEPEPTVAYRQHSENLLGSNLGWFARLWRIGLLLKGRFRDWNDCNIMALQSMYSYLTPENQEILDRFSAARQQSFFPRVYGIWKSGVYRQTLLGNLGLLLAALLKRV